MPQKAFRAVLMLTLLRILFTLLLAAEVVHVVYHLLDGRDPPVGLLLAGRHEVEIFFAALEEDGEA